MDDLDVTVEDNDAYEVNLSEKVYGKLKKDILAILCGIAILLFCIGVIGRVS